MRRFEERVVRRLVLRCRSILAMGLIDSRKFHALQTDANRPTARPELRWRGTVLDLEIDLKKIPPDEVLWYLERSLVNLAPLAALRRERADPLPLHLNNKTRGRAHLSGKGPEFEP